MSFRRTVSLLLLLALFCGGCSLFRRRGPRASYKKLSPPVAYEMMRDSPEMLVIDLRTPQQYDGETGHLRAAKNMPLARLPYRMLEILPFREDTILIYCETDECVMPATKLLADSGFENIVLLDGGIEQWIREGFKTVLPARIAKRRGELEPEPVMPTKPGEKKNDPNREVPVKPPMPPPPPPETQPSPPPPPPGLAAPRQIG